MKLLVSLILVGLVFTLGVFAQVGNQAKPTTQHFENAELSFDAPAAWKVTDSGSDSVQFVTAARGDGAAQIAVTARVVNDLQCDFVNVGKTNTDSLVEKVANQIRAARPLQTSPVKTQLGGVEIDGLQFHGMMNNRVVISEVYSLRINLRFINVVYLRAGDAPADQPAWELMRTTLKFIPPIFRATAAHAGATANSNVMNGRALHLVQPAYPQTARMAHANGVVVIQIVIDEDGNVASAQAITGHPLLQPVSVEAAKASKFSPTKLCGEPVRITGVIQYNFIAM